MFNDTTKPAPPLPTINRTDIEGGVTRLQPLSRRGYGPGLIILIPDTEKSMSIIDGVPSQLIKWAEEGYTVIEIQQRALRQGVQSALNKAIDALMSCEKCGPKGKIGLVVYSPELWNQVAPTLPGITGLVGAVLYADSISRSDLKPVSLPVLRHLAGPKPSAVERPITGTEFYYPKLKSYLFASPFQEQFNYWSESISHTRNLSFLKPLMGGPYFDLETIWDEHTYYEFADRSVEHTMSTMVDQPYVNHVPTMTGGIGREKLTNFYRHNFIFNNSENTDLELISRTLGIDRVVDEFIFKFTHDKQLDWLLPGIPPTNKKVEVPFTAVVNIRGDRLYHEHIAWDQGSVLAQLGLMPEYLPYPYPIPENTSSQGKRFEYRVPVAGIETADKMRDRNSVQSNEMFKFRIREVTE
ncbi:hypothetical protein PHISCL_01667 [Aspergillus sclerotialis]|uniref:Carboxymethylenebutenolidase n=1 Tax=Aspergillus sclerotialis TaxID=2070753 RepID=A0A3A2ZS33_9EURO|nr:hypothetical protein PHISCL_01667 [Aspergillus sclerotialis]